MQHFHFSRSFFCFGSSGSLSCSLSTRVPVSWLLLSPAPPPTFNPLPFYCTKHLQFCLISYPILIYLDSEQNLHFLEVRLIITFVLGVSFLIPNVLPMCLYQTSKHCAFPRGILVNSSTSSQKNRDASLQRSELDILPWVYTQVFLPYLQRDSRTVTNQNFVHNYCLKKIQPGL